MIHHKGLSRHEIAFKILNFWVSGEFYVMHMMLSVVSTNTQLKNHIAVGENAQQYHQ